MAWYRAEICVWFDAKGEVEARREMDMAARILAANPTIAASVRLVEEEGQKDSPYRCNICGGLVTYDGTKPSVCMSKRGRDPAPQQEEDMARNAINDGATLADRVIVMKTPSYFCPEHGGSCGGESCCCADKHMPIPMRHQPWCVEKTIHPLDCICRP
jgi:hypothetical protein